MTDDRGSLPLTLDTGGSGRQAALLPGGPLEGEVRDGYACFWFPVEGGGFVSLVWPEDLIARDHPLRVENPEGEVVAQVGDTVAGMVGGHPSDIPGRREGSSQCFVHSDTFAPSENFWHS